MTHIGLIYCGYGTCNYIAPSLAPWIQLRRSGEVKVTICAVNVLFAGFEGKDDGTRELLRGYLERGEIDYLIDGPDNIPETTARGMALTWLRDTAKVDLTWMVDSDEMYDPNMILRIIDMVDANPWVDWFRIALKNYVFDFKTHLVDPFTPPRIHRMIPNRYPNVRPTTFTADNDVGYQDKDDPSAPIWPQDVFVSRTIPANYVWVPHITWQNDERSRRKIEYQLKGRGWPTCSFSWDDSKGGLIFNPVLPAPKTIREEG